MRIEIIFDTICPWCYIGKRRLEQALLERPHVTVEKRWRPFLLNPDMLSDGLDRRSYLAQKFGSETRVQRMQDAIAQVGESVEIEFAFDRIERTANSMESHRLVRFADRTGKSDACVEALFVSYFVNGHDIGQIETLIAIGTEVGLDRGALRGYLESGDDRMEIIDENRRVHTMGVAGVPTFIFAGEYAIAGAQDPTVLTRLIDAAAVLPEPAVAAP